ncbi:SGNH/GDSL hydrolase family protein [Spirosoma validum]|uniref:SGNH/GDSL hydrolase family protein n=1 Tax=Spirosoma validum TaxID=2771355 RepID=A0A927B1S9_9BACT|nr:SGNH/GDSL hydrolase family protein [Spirosoma validum]MBD2753692.1 SGNH/GDSL hydrolase family protein [Spirosoma validum]
MRHDFSQANTSVRGKVIRFWALLTCVLFVSLAFCYVYDQVWGNADRLISGVAYQNVFSTLFWLDILSLGFGIGFTSRKNSVQNGSLALLSGMVCLLVLEGVGYLILIVKHIQTPPITFRRFYIPSGVASIRPFPAGDLDPVAGRLHVPNGYDTFVTCQDDTIHWSYNAAGAHDRQRQLINPDLTKKRIAIVGDSFLEGYMVNTSDRCSSILERKTGLEHLNFAVNGSNPVHYYLMYKRVAKAYAADVLIIGFLPANDFEILDERIAYRRVEHPQYNPYWQGVYPNYTLHYSLANVSQSIFHGNTTQASLLNVVDSVYATLSLGDKFKADVLAHSSLFRLADALTVKRYRNGQFTKYEQFSEEEWHYVSYSLTKLIAEAKGKKVLIVSIPTLADLTALKKGTPNRIDPLLANFCQEKGVNFIPLAPSFLAYKGNLGNLYIECDGHWSAKGESFAADALLRHPIYCSLIR